MNRTARTNLSSNATVRAAFALIEALVIVAVSIVLLALLLAAGSDARREARLGDDIAKLRDLGAATTAYAADCQDLIWSFSWQGGVTYTTPYPDLNFATSDLQAQANQAIYILRTHGNVPEAPPINGWIANVRYSHFALAVHQARPLPDFAMISSADKLRLQWAQNPTGTGQGPHGAYPCGGLFPTAHCHTLPRSASFELVTCAYDGSPVGSRISQGELAHTYFAPPQSELGGRPLSEVAFPHHKVVVGDTRARHFGECAPYAVQDEARLPLLFGDGAVAVRAASEANPGWNPNAPGSAAPTAFGWQPDPGDPCYTTPQITIPAGRFRWTRGTATLNGLAGRDFDGPETCSGQPGCP